MSLILRATVVHMHRYRSVTVYWLGRITDSNAVGGAVHYSVGVHVLFAFSNRVISWQPIPMSLILRATVVHMHRYRPVINKSNKLTLQFLFSQWIPSQDQMHIYAIDIIRYHRNDLLRFLVEEQHFNLREDLFSVALSNGCLACVQYCFEKGCREVDYNTLCEHYCSAVYERTPDGYVLQN